VPFTTPPAARRTPGGAAAAPPPPPRRAPPSTPERRSVRNPTLSFLGGYGRSAPAGFTALRAAPHRWLAPARARAPRAQRHVIPRSGVGLLLAPQDVESRVALALGV
jgi:hypothetical protein